MARSLSNPVRLAAPLQGVDGRTTLAKARAPLVTDGRIGDFFVDTAAKKLYGPKGAAGWPDNGLIKGDKGWVPVLAAVTDGARCVHQVIDWTGGEGTKPATGSYIGSTGLVALIADAIDIRGAEGPQMLIDELDDGADDFVYDDHLAAAKDGEDNTRQSLKRVLGAGGLLQFETTADAEALVVPASVKAVQINGEATADGGPGQIRRRVDSEPVSGLKHRSADRFTADGGTDAANGGWWVAVIADATPESAAAGVATTGRMNEARTKDSVMANAELADFTPSLPSTYARPIGERLRESRSVLDWISSAATRAAILAGTSTTDVTTELQAAFASGEDLYIPAGRYNISDELAFSATQGQTVQGEGRHRARFVIDAATYNMAANSIVKFGAVYQAVRDVGFYCVQPNVSTRSECNQYPPVFDMNGRTRNEISRVRVEGGWKFTAEDLNKNNGGSIINDVQCGCLAGGVFLDGCYDSTYINRFHYWPFGILNLTNLYNDVYRDRSHFGLDFGKIDDFHITDCLIFGGQARFEDKGIGGPFGGITNSRMDIDGCKITVSAGNVTWDGLQQSSTTTTGGVEVTGGSLLLVAPILKAGAGDGTNPNIVKVSGGLCQIIGGKAELTGLDSARVGLVSGGRLVVDGGFYVATVAGRTRTVPMFEQTGGVMIIAGATPEPKGAGAGTFVKFGADNSNNLLSENSFSNSWDVEFPTPATGLAGVYFGRDTTTLPVLTFATPGDLSVSYATQVLREKIVGRRVIFSLQLTCTPTFTTASGALTITGGTFRNGGRTILGPVSNYQNINHGTTRPTLSWQKGPNSQAWTIVQSGNNTTSAALSAAQITSGSAITINIFGEYPLDA